MNVFEIKDKYVNNMGGVIDCKSEFLVKHSGDQVVMILFNLLYFAI